MPGNEAAVAGRGSSPGDIGIRTCPKRDVLVDFRFVEQFERECDSPGRLGKRTVEQAFANCQTTVANLAERCEPEAARACVAEDCYRAMSESGKSGEQNDLALVLGGERTVSALERGCGPQKDVAHDGKR